MQKILEKFIKIPGKMQKKLEKSGKFISPKKWEPCLHTLRLRLLLRSMWLPLFSVVLDTPSDGRYQQTSKEINAKTNTTARCARALSFSRIGT